MLDRRSFQTGSTRQWVIPKHGRFARQSLANCPFEMPIGLKDSELTRKNLYRPQDFYDESHDTDPSKISHV